MDTFAPEFSKFWLTEPTAGETEAAGDDDENAENAALKLLADLVSAARSIV